jgi:hypothetical protein
MSPKPATPNHREPFIIQYKAVADFLQAVQEAGVRTVHLEALQRRIRASEVWGILLTARLSDEVHVAWVVASHAMTPSAHQRASALSEQARILAQVQTLVALYGLNTRPGFYAIPEAVAFQYAAALPEEASADLEGGQA